MLSLKNIYKIYHNFNALSDLNLEVSTGEVLGLLGPNASGKSTTLKILAGILNFSSGEIFWNQNKIDPTSMEYKKLVAYVPEKPAIYSELTVKEYLMFVYKLSGCSKKEFNNLFAEAVAKFNLEDVVNKLCGNLSKGYQQRLMLAQAIQRKTEILLLDEPNTGLDPVQLDKLSEIIKAVAKEQIVILCSHQLKEVEALCSRVVGLSQGKKIFDQKLNNSNQNNLLELYQQAISYV